MPAGFAHTDDMKISLFGHFLKKALLSAGVVLSVAGTGAVQCVQNSFFSGLVVGFN